MTDKDLNIYEIENLYYDFSNKKLLGKNIIVNDNNKISKRKHLPRIKSNSLIIENNLSTFQKTVYTNWKRMVVLLG